MLLTDEEGGPQIVRVKDRLMHPASGGYRDLMLNLMIDGHVCELQFQLSMLMAIKPQSHRIYNLLRSVGWEGEDLQMEAGNDS